MTGSTITAPHLEAHQLCFGYLPGRQALQDVSFTVPRGARVALLGPNGSGKSTLLLTINGTLPATGGSVRLNGEPLVQHRRALRAWRQRVGLVLSDPEHMLLGATVETDLSFGPLNLGIPEAVVRRMVEEAIDAFGLAPWRSHPVSSLSEGTRKRVALAGMVVLKPEVLLLDEPANALDAPGQRALRAILAQLSGAGTTLIVATHDADFAWEWATHWMVMDQGRVTFFRPVDEAEQHLGAFPGVMVPHVVQCARLLRERGLLPESTPTPRTLDALAAPLATGLPCPH
jgi:cobalt/nickel transport system ATP-binding protein